MFNFFFILKLIERTRTVSFKLLVSVDDRIEYLAVVLMTLKDVSETCITYTVLFERTCFLVLNILSISPSRKDLLLHQIKLKLNRKKQNSSTNKIRAMKQIGDNKQKNIRSGIGNINR